MSAAPSDPAPAADPAPPADQQLSPHPFLRVERSGHVQTVTLTNPAKRNAQTPSLWRALAEVAARTPDDVRVVVLRGEGQSFSAGLDRRMLAPGGVAGEPDLMAVAAGSAPSTEELIDGFQRGFTAWAHLPAVVVASVQGHAIGAGFQLALAADLRVVADDVQLAMRETSLGMVPDLGGTGPLVRLVGYSRALEICATGRFVGAQEAVAIGLASAAVPADQLDAATADLVAALIATPKDALRALKPLLRQAIDAPADEQLAEERRVNARLLAAMAQGG